MNNDIEYLKDIQEEHDLSMTASNGPSDNLCLENITEFFSELSDMALL